MIGIFSHDKVDIMTVKISVPTDVFVENCLAVDHVRGLALYEQMQTNLFDDFLAGAHFTQNEEALIVYKGDRKVFIIHGINAIVDEKTLAYQFSLAYKVDTELWQLFKDRCPDISEL